MNFINESGRRQDYVERYCPKCKENVIMQRIHGVNTTLKCMNYENCKEDKDNFCGEKSLKGS